MEPAKERLISRLNTLAGTYPNYTGQLEKRGDRFRLKWYDHEELAALDNTDVAEQVNVESSALERIAPRILNLVGVDESIDCMTDGAKVMHWTLRADIEAHPTRIQFSVPNAFAAIAEKIESGDSIGFANSAGSNVEGIGPLKPEPWPTHKPLRQFSVVATACMSRLMQSDSQDWWDEIKLFQDELHYSFSSVSGLPCVVGDWPVFAVAEFNEHDHRSLDFAWFDPEASCLRFKRLLRSAKFPKSDSEFVRLVGEGGRLETGYSDYLAHSTPAWTRNAKNLKSFAIEKLKELIAYVNSYDSALGREVSPSESAEPQSRANASPLNAHTVALTPEEQAIGILAKGETVKAEIARRIGINVRQLHADRMPNFDKAWKTATAKEGRRGVVNSDGVVDGIHLDPDPEF